VPLTFTQLDEHFLSLAQRTDHYESLAALGIQTARDVLQGLRDVSFAGTKKEFVELDAFRTALVRFPPAREALKRGARRLIASGILPGPLTKPEEAPIAFEFSCRRTGSSGDMSHKVDIVFDRVHLGLHRMWGLVGSNGAGKTFILSALARCLSGLDGKNAVTAPQPSFQKVIAVSYSPWDTFTTPSGEGDRIPYVYCGLRSPGSATEGQTLNIARARKIASADLEHIRANASVSARWVNAMRACGLDRVGSPIETAVTLEGSLDGLEFCSAGEQLATIVVTRLVRHIERDSLVLFDEPELHMHPGLLSGLLRVLHELLVERDAFAIVGTHSPIPLQEIPSRCVRVLDLVEATTHTRGLDEQCFGASLGSITANAFRVRQDERNWSRFIADMVLIGHTKAEVYAALDGDPGIGVEMLLASLLTGGEEEEVVR
jgi:predicted ATPase